MLRLFRGRRNDPLVQADPVRQRIAGHDAPSISSGEFLDINLPDYQARRKMNARDPHSVVSGFRVCMYVILPRCLGYFKGETGAQAQHDLHTHRQANTQKRTGRT